MHPPARVVPRTVGPLPARCIYESGVEAEVLAYGNRQNRFNPLCLIQAIIFLWFLAHFVVFSIEAAGSQSSNLWFVAIFWWIVGFLFVLLSQSVASYLHTRQNHEPGTRNLWHLGRPQFREIVLANIVSILVYFLVGVLLTVWLAEFRTGECCTKRDVDPETEVRAYVARIGVTIVSAIACLHASIVYMRTLLVHVWPVRTVTHIIKTELREHYTGLRSQEIQRQGSLPTELGGSRGE